MCSKSDNSCREEKLGCIGCYYNRRNKYTIKMLYEMIENALKKDKTSLLITKNKEQFVLELKIICMNSLGMIKYKIENDRIIVETLKEGKKLLIIQELK